MANIDSSNSKRSLRVRVSLLLVWDKQFEIIKEKMSKAVFKLNNITMVVSTTSMYYNIYFIKKVYFGCRVISINSKQEEILKKIYELVILQKLRLSANFPRLVLYSRKSALRVGLIAPRTIINGSAMKLYLEYQ